MASYLQLAIEESPRYEGAASTTPYRVSTNVAYFPLTSAVLNPNPTHVDRSDELRSIEGGVPLLIDSYDPEASIAERCYINNLTYLLQLAGLTGVHTAGDGVITDPDGTVIPAGANRWVFNKRGGITAKTAQLIAAYDAEGVFLKGQGFGVSELGLNAAGELTTDLTGLVLANIADPSLSASYDVSSIIPARRGDLTLTWLGSSGVTSDFELAIANPLERVRSLSLATPSNFADLMEHGDERVKLTGSIPKRRLADADVDALMAGTTFTAEARWKTTKSVGATAAKYALWVEMAACQYSGGEFDELGNKRRFGGSFDFWAAWDESAAYDFRITLVNAVTAVETYS